MSAIFALLLVQAVLGLVDNVWNHELRLNLPARRSARVETALHGVRHLLYAVIFGSLGWFELHGGYALAFGLVIATEAVITVWDFLEEDRSRAPLPQGERVLHTVLTLLFGAFVALMIPRLLTWWALPSDLVVTHYGWVTWAFTSAAVGVFAWGLRDLFAALEHLRVPRWRRCPSPIGEPNGAGAVLVAGATGFIGRHLVRRLLADGYRVIVYTRDRERSETLFGPHVRTVTRLQAVPGSVHVNAIVNLAGAPIFGIPWTTWRRRALVHSRVDPTKALVRWARYRRRRPRILINASAVGFYGAVREELVDETSTSGSDFAARLCRVWERSASAATNEGIRFDRTRFEGLGVCRLRFGLVLGADGGTFPALRRSFALGLGALLGSGAQPFPWIHIEDAVGLIAHTLKDEAFIGRNSLAVNAVAPDQVTHAEFMAALSSALGALVVGKVPAWMLRRGLGEMATLVLDGQRVRAPAKVPRGFDFRYPTVREALRALVLEEEGLTSPTRRENLRRTSVGDVDGRRAFDRHALAPGKVVDDPAETLPVVFYNGACPVCQAAVDAHRAHETGTAQFCDVTSTAHPLGRYGLRDIDTRGRLYLKRADGQIVSGWLAIREVWNAVPGYRRLTYLSRLPGGNWLLEVGYDALLAPWLTRRSCGRTGQLAGGRSDTRSTGQAAQE